MKEKTTKVLIAVDDRKSSKAMLSAFHDFVQTPGEIILLYVERPGGIPSSASQGERTPDRHEESFEDGRIAVTTVKRYGSPAVEILKASEEEGVELIILGYSGKGGLNRLINGSVARRVERGARVPVLIAKKTVAYEDADIWKEAYIAFSLWFITAVVFGVLVLKLILQHRASLP